jgi:hypothetical protein
MRFFTSGFLAAGLIAASGIHASANTYDFTYTFTDVTNCCAAPSPYTGYEIIGSFTGTPNGPNDVINISNVSAELLNASHVAVLPSLGTLTAYSYIGPANQGGPSNFQLGGAVASFNGLDNNFLFANSPTFGAWTNYFYVIQPWNNGGPGSTTIAAQLFSTSLPGNSIDAYNGQYFPNDFTLTQTPLPSTWSMFVVGLIALGIFGYPATKENSAARATA